MTKRERSEKLLIDETMSLLLGKRVSTDDEEHLKKCLEEENNHEHPMYRWLHDL